MDRNDTTLSRSIVSYDSNNDLPFDMSTACEDISNDNENEKPVNIDDIIILMDVSGVRSYCTCINNNSVDTECDELVTYLFNPLRRAKSLAYLQHNSTS